MQKKKKKGSWVDRQTQNHAVPEQESPPQPSRPDPQQDISLVGKRLSLVALLGGHREGSTQLWCHEISFHHKSPGFRCRTG